MALTTSSSADFAVCAVASSGALVLPLLLVSCSDSIPRDTVAQTPSATTLVGRFVDEFPRVGAFRKPVSERSKLSLQTRRIGDRDFVLLAELVIGTEISHDRILGALEVPKSEKPAERVTFDCRTRKVNSITSEVLVALVDQSTVQTNYKPRRVWNINLTNYRFTETSTEAVDCQLANYATQPPPTQKTFPENFRW